MKIIKGILGLLWKIYIALVFAITAIIMYPLITPLLFFEKTKKYSFRLFVIWSWIVRVLCFYFVKIKGAEHKPNEPCIIIANHTSYLDIFLLFSVLPKQRFLFLGKSEILQYPLLRRYFKQLNIPVYRGNKLKAAKAVVHAVRATKQGWAISIFPEGGIPEIDFPGVAPFKSGAFQIAKSSKLPIVTMTYLNNWKLFSDPSYILGPARPGISHVVIHEQITVDVVLECSVEELSDICMQLMQNDLNQFYQK